MRFDLDPVARMQRERIGQRPACQANHRKAHCQYPPGIARSDQIARQREFAATYGQEIGAAMPQHRCEIIRPEPVICQTETGCPSDFGMQCSEPIIIQANRFGNTAS